VVSPLAFVGAVNSVPDVHAGHIETSLMLAIAPAMVTMSRLNGLDFSTDWTHLRAVVSTRGVSLPWNSDDRNVACHGILGDPRGATATDGATYLSRIVAGIWTAHDILWTWSQ
jgi:creatinine amidohydrolase